eukprot:12738862-Ditylum_brightwellii.AAC.1
MDTSNEEAHEGEVVDKDNLVNYWKTPPCSVHSHFSLNVTSSLSSITQTSTFSSVSNANLPPPKTQEESAFLEKASKQVEKWDKAAKE